MILRAFTVKSSWYNPSLTLRYPITFIHSRGFVHFATLTKQSPRLYPSAFIETCAAIFNEIRYRIVTSASVQIRHNQMRLLDIFKVENAAQTTVETYNTSVLKAILKVEFQDCFRKGKHHNGSGSFNQFGIL